MKAFPWSAIEAINTRKNNEYKKTGGNEER
jgi:hypothetical protein